MLMIQSKEGNVKVVAFGSVTEICADTASAIKGLAGQMIQPVEDTAHKLVVLKMLQSALNYAIDDAKKEAHT